MSTKLMIHDLRRLFVVPGAIAGIFAFAACDLYENTDNVPELENDTTGGLDTGGTTENEDTSTGDMAPPEDDDDMDSGDMPDTSTGDGGTDSGGGDTETDTGGEDPDSEGGAGDSDSDSGG